MWVVGKSGNHFFHLKFDGEKIAAMIKSIRSEMEFDSAGQASRVSVGLLHDLYQSLIAPAMQHLAGVRHIMVVPAGPLQSLPFGMLVGSPSPEIKSDEDYRKVDWLAEHYAISVLPSVSSIQAFRQFAKLGSSQEPFAGFGDPLIGGSDGTTRGKRPKLDVSTVFRNVTTNTNTPGSASATEIADVEAIRSAPRLPETADELRAMAKVLKSDQNSLWLQENATETKIKHLDLSKYRTIAFATHGVMAGGGLLEPEPYVGFQLASVLGSASAVRHLPMVSSAMKRWREVSRDVLFNRSGRIKDRVGALGLEAVDFDQYPMVRRVVVQMSAPQHLLGTVLRFVGGRVLFALVFAAYDTGPRPAF